MHRTRRHRRGSRVHKRRRVRTQKRRMRGGRVLKEELTGPKPS